MTERRKEEIMMEKAVQSLQECEFNDAEPFTVLSEKVVRTVRGGLKETFRWRHLRIDYNVKDETGCYRSRFTVSNPLTGVQKTWYVRDFIGVTGAIKYQTLASRIKNT